MGVFSLVLVMLLPAGVWLFLRRRYRAGVLPLIVGLLTYIVIILPRHGVRLAVGYYELQEQSVWGFYILRGIISGGFEEGARYLVFKRVIPDRDRTGDWLSYALGHGVIETFITEQLVGIDFGGVTLIWSELVTGIAFSIAMSALAFTAAHQGRWVLVLTAFIFHWALDVLPAFYFVEVFSVGGLVAADVILIAISCGAAYLLCRNE